MFYEPAIAITIELAVAARKKALFLNKALIPSCKENLISSSIYFENAGGVGASALNSHRLSASDIVANTA